MATCFRTKALDIDEEDHDEIITKAVKNRKKDEIMAGAKIQVFLCVRLCGGDECGLVVLGIWSQSYLLAVRKSMFVSRERLFSFCVVVGKIEDGDDGARDPKSIWNHRIAKSDGQRSPE